MGFWSGLSNLAENFFNSLSGVLRDPGTPFRDVPGADPYGSSPLTSQAAWAETQHRLWTQKYGAASVSDRNGVLTFRGNQDDGDGDIYESHVVAAPHSITRDLRLAGSAGDDEMIGGRGDDIIGGSTGRNVMSGNQGNDVFLATNGVDILIGGSGHDRFMASVGDRIRGGNDGDVVVVPQTRGTIRAFDVEQGGDKFDFGPGARVQVTNVRLDDFKMPAGGHDTSAGRETAHVASATITDLSRGTVVQATFDDDTRYWVNDSRKIDGSWFHDDFVM